MDAVTAASRNSSAMNVTHRHWTMAGEDPDLAGMGHPNDGTDQLDDDRDDEHSNENEAPVREHDENTEAPEEFEVDEEDLLAHPEDDEPDRLEAE